MKGTGFRLWANEAGKKELPVFYHGTSEILGIKDMILPPVQTGIKREDWRAKYSDKVFFTTSLLSAEMFAKKACRKYGGNPVVFKVRPVGQFFRRMDVEYIADRAVILEKM